MNNNRRGKILKKIKWVKISIGVLALLITLNMLSHEREVLSYGTNQLDFLANIGLEIYYCIQWLGLEFILLIIWIGIMMFEKRKTIS